MLDIFLSVLLFCRILGDRALTIALPVGIFAGLISVRYNAVAFVRENIVTKVAVIVSKNTLMRTSFKTFSASPSTITQGWYLVDADGKTLGRLASEIARRLRGKHKAIYTPHMDTGDYIVVVNADKVRVTGKKATDKIYYRHSGYPGGIKSQSFEKLMEKKPERALELAVKGMLPRGPLGRAMFRKLRVFAGATHSHVAQKPQPLDIGAAV